MIAPSLKSLEVFKKECGTFILTRSCFICKLENYCGPEHRPPTRSTFEDRYNSILKKIRKEKLAKLLS